MTKYIHYLKLHEPGILISDNQDETAKGYTLGLEIDCNCFDEVLKCMMVTHNVPFDIQDNIVTNENLFGFKNEFIRCMDVLGKFSKENYEIRVLNGNWATWFTKRVLSRV